MIEFVAHQSTLVIALVWYVVGCSARDTFVVLLKARNDTADPSPVA
jgi:hypothetical protein